MAITYYGGRIVDDSGNAVTDIDNEFGLCTVTFKANGGSGEDVVMRVYPDTQIILPDASLCGFSPISGTYFAGWSTTKDIGNLYFRITYDSSVNTKISWYNTATYEFSEKVVVSTGLTLYAVWFNPSLCTMDMGRVLSELNFTNRVMGVYSKENTTDSTVSFGGGTFEGTIKRLDKISQLLTGSEFSSVSGNTSVNLDDLADKVGEISMKTHTFDSKGVSRGGVNNGHEVLKENAYRVLSKLTFGGLSTYSGFRVSIYVNEYVIYSGATPPTRHERYAPFGAFICIYSCNLPSALWNNSITFLSSEGNSVLKTYSAPYHTAVLLPSPSAYQETGSTLAAWSATYNSAPLYRPTGTFVNVGDYATWTAYYQDAKFIIVYDLNGGYSKSTITESTDLAYAVSTGDTIVVNPGSSYTRDGYVHVGWTRSVSNAEVDDKGALVPSKCPYFLYPDHPKSSKESSEEYTYITLKAVWVPKGTVTERTFTVKDDESVQPDVSFNYEMDVYDNYTYFVPRSDTPGIAVDGYNFEAWMNGSEKIVPFDDEENGYSTTVAIRANNVTYIALHSLVKYTFKLTLTNLKRDSTQVGNEIEKSSEPTASTSFNFDLDAPKGIGVYSFTGWGIGANSTTVQIPETATSFTLSLDTVGATVNGREVSITLCAQWVDARPTYRILFQYPSCTDLTSGPPSVLESGSMETGTSMNFTIPTTIPRRQSQWIFLGWMKTMNPYTGADLIDPGSTVTVTRANDNQETKGELKLYAHWYRYKYDLSYNLNGGSSADVSPYLEYSVLFGPRSVMIPRSTPTHPTQTFSNWVDGSTSYDPGDTVSLSPSKLTVDLDSGDELFYKDIGSWTFPQDNTVNPSAKILIAQYTGQKAILRFDLRGGTGSFENLSAEKNGNNANHTFTLPIDKPVRPSYVFDTWSESSSDRGYRPHAPESTVEVMYNTVKVLYAHWIYSPTGSIPLNVEYDGRTGEATWLKGEVKNHGVVQYGNSTEFSLDLPSVLPDDIKIDDELKKQYSVQTNSNYRVMLYLRNKEGDLNRVTSTAWYYPKKTYSSDGIGLSLYISRTSVPNTVSGDTYLDDYVVRVVTIDGSGNEYNAYHSFKIAPAGKQDIALGPPECTLTKYMGEGYGNSVKYERRMISIEGITRFQRSFDVSLTEMPVLTRQVRDRYIMDLGTTETYSLSFTRVNPTVVDDKGDDSKAWSNAKWIVEFRRFLDFWQNLSYSPTGNGYERTGGFKFTYIPSDVSLFPIIEKNVFVKGNVDFDYLVGKAKGDITLVVANMQMKQLYAPSTCTFHYCRTESDAKYKARDFTVTGYQDLPFTIPSFPAGYNEDCIFWREVTTGSEYYPGDSITAPKEDAYLYPILGKVIEDATLEVKSAGSKSVTVPEDARVAKMIITGGGGAGALGSYSAHLGVVWGSWMDDDLVNYKSGGGGGAGYTNYSSLMVTPGTPLVATVGKGGEYNGTTNGEDSYVLYNGIRHIARGGSGANGMTGGANYFAGGDGFNKEGYTDLGGFSTSENPGSTSASSPKGVPGKGNKLGSGGGASNLEEKVALSSVTSIGGYWDGEDLIPPAYGGGGAGGGFDDEFLPSNIPGFETQYGEPGNGASGYIKVVFYKG